MRWLARSLSFRNQPRRVWLLYVLLVLACLLVSALPAQAQNPTSCWGGWEEQTLSGKEWNDLAVMLIVFFAGWYP